MPCSVIGTAALTGYLLLIWFAFNHAAQAAQSSQATYVYAIQLESSRKPNLDDYQGILHLGALYTYQDRKNKALTRVRLGYYPSRHDAATALDQIRKLGFPDAYITKIRNPAKQTTQAAAKPTAPPQPLPAENAVKHTPASSKPAPRRYIIQLESSYRPNMADFDSIRRHGKVYTKKSTKDDKLIYVRMGSYTNLAEARRILDKVKAAGFHDAYIIRTRQTVVPPPVPQKQAKIPDKSDEDKPAKKTPPAGHDNADIPHLYAIHITTTEDTDMSRYDPIRPYGVVYMSYRYSRNAAERNQIRIMAGYYENQTKAQEALAMIRSAGFPEARIVKVPDRSKMTLNQRRNKRAASRLSSRQTKMHKVDEPSPAKKQDPFVPPLQPNPDPFTEK